MKILNLKKPNKPKTNNNKNENPIPLNTSHAFSTEKACDVLFMAYVAAHFIHFDFKIPHF